MKNWFKKRTKKEVATLKPIYGNYILVNRNTDLYTRVEDVRIELTDSKIVLINRKGKIRGAYSVNVMDILDEQTYTMYGQYEVHKNKLGTEMVMDRHRTKLAPVLKQNMKKIEKADIKDDLVTIIRGLGAK